MCMENVTGCKLGVSKTEDMKFEGILNISSNWYMNNRFHLFFLVAAGKKSIVTDPYKPFGKHMHQKHPQKVYSLDRMWDVSSTIPVIFYKVSNCLICHSKDPLVAVHQRIQFFRHCEHCMKIRNIQRNKQMVSFYRITFPVFFQ